MIKANGLISSEGNLKIFSFEESIHLKLIPMLTKILHESYGELAKNGMKYLASHQPKEKTLDRLKSGYSYLGFVDEELVSTITLKLDTPNIPIKYYRSSDVALFTQFAVKKSHQGKKIGRKMMDLVEFEAFNKGVSFLALDTSENAVDLIQIYKNRGYEKVDEYDWDFTNYKSVILSKKLISSKKIN